MTLLLSALIGLMLVSFATLPQAYASQVSKTTSTTHAGYDATVSSGEITQITAEWNQPAIICQPNVAASKLVIDLAIFGFTLSAGMQTGFSIATVGFCSQGSSTPIYVSAANFGNITASPTQPILTFNAGDMISASITFNRFNAIFTGKLADLTTGQSTSVSVANPDFLLVAGSSFASWTVTGGQGGGVVFGQFTVPIEFSNCTVTVSGHTLTISKIGSSKIGMVARVTRVDASGNTMATTSSRSMAGSSFKVTWISST